MIRKSTPPYVPAGKGRAQAKVGKTGNPASKQDTQEAKRQRMRNAALEGLGAAAKSSQERQAEIDRNIDEMDRAAIARMGQSAEAPSSALGRFSQSQGFAARRRKGV